MHFNCQKTLHKSYVLSWVYLVNPYSDIMDSIWPSDSKKSEMCFLPQVREKSIWQNESVFHKKWKSVLQTRRSFKEMTFFFLKLITINSTDRVRIIIDSPSHSYKVYTMQQICKNKWDIVCNQCKPLHEFLQWVIGYHTL